MFFGIMYPRSVKAWMRKARHQANHHTAVPIEDLQVPMHLEALSKSRRTELGYLLKDHKEYKQYWQSTVKEYTAAFKQLTNPELDTFDRMSALYLLASAYHGGSEMMSLQNEPFYQTQETLVHQLMELSGEVSERARQGSKEDFLLLRRFLNEVAKGGYEDQHYYPRDYPELVDRYIPNPRYDDYLVHAMFPMSQARYSNSLNFLRLFIASHGGSQQKLNSPPMRTHAGQYFDELDLYILYDIEDRIEKLTKGEKKNI